LGGLIIAYALQEKNFQDQFTGAILHGPPVALPAQATTVLLMGAKVMANLVPTLGIDDLNLATYVRDPKVKKSYDEDPLVWHKPMKAKVADTVVIAIGNAMVLPEKISLPVLYLQGTADEVVPANAAEPWYQKLLSSDKKLIKFLGGYHANFLDFEKEIVYKIVQEWIKTKMEKKESGSVIEEVMCTM